MARFWEACLYLGAGGKAQWWKPYNKWLWGHKAVVMPFQWQPGGSDGKESGCNTGDSIPGSGRSPGVGNVYPLQYACLGSRMDRRVWRATVQESFKCELQTLQLKAQTLTHLSFWFGIPGMLSHIWTQCITQNGFWRRPAAMWAAGSLVGWAAPQPWLWGTGLIACVCDLFVNLPVMD